MRPPFRNCPYYSIEAVLQSNEVTLEPDAARWANKLQ